MPLNWRLARPRLRRGALSTPATHCYTECGNALDRPRLPVRRSHDLDRRSALPAGQSESQRKHFAIKRLSASQSHRADRNQLVAAQPQQFQAPRVAVDDQQLASPDTRVERHFVTRPVIIADNFDGEIRPATPMGIAILILGVRKIHGDIGTPVVLLPIINAITHVCAR